MEYSVRLEQWNSLVKLVGCVFGQCCESSSEYSKKAFLPHGDTMRSAIGEFARQDADLVT
jgi:hypothetical protein